MTKRELIKKSHVWNEQFVRELRDVLGLMPSLCLWRTMRTIAMSGERALDGEGGWEMLRFEVALVKEMADRLQALLDEWPNAVCLFFPESGHGGRIRLFHEFYRKTYPAFFPGRPVAWHGSSRKKGQTRCGIARRIRKDTYKAFIAWDHFKAGDNPMTIARREFSSRSQSRVGKKHLMVIRRRLERASRLIYGRSMPTNRKMRRLIGFDIQDHIGRCVVCRSAGLFEQMCALARDYANQDQKN